MAREHGDVPALQVLLAFLRACRGMDLAATALLLGATIVLASCLMMPAGHGRVCEGSLVISLLAGLTAKYFALRVQFDRELFEKVAAGTLDLEKLDRGLASFFPKSISAAGREWEPRLQGAMSLARRQLMAFGVQGVFLVLGLLSQLML